MPKFAHVRAQRAKRISKPKEIVPCLRRTSTSPPHQAGTLGRARIPRHKSALPERSADPFACPGAPVVRCVCIPITASAMWLAMYMHMLCEHCARVASLFTLGAGTGVLSYWDSKVGWTCVRCTGVLIVRVLSCGVGLGTTTDQANCDGPSLFIQLFSRQYVAL